MKPNKNKHHYRDIVCNMPRLQNFAPYDNNHVTNWFAHTFNCSSKQGQKHFDNARSLSHQSSKADPLKYPPFLIHDRSTLEWHGSNIP
jgi:hypothetical protein